MEEDGDGGHDAKGLTGEEGGTDRKAVSEVVEEVGKKVQITGNANLLPVF